MSHYHLIPEGVFQVTSASTKNTANYTSSVGDFNYRHIKPSLFFGYKLLKEKNFTVKIAEPEKVILDYFYINKLNDFVEIEEMRFNEIVAKEIISFASTGATTTDVIAGTMISGWLFTLIGNILYGFNIKKKN